MGNTDLIYKTGFSKSVYKENIYICVSSLTAAPFCYFYLHFANDLNRIMRYFSYPSVRSVGQINLHFEVYTAFHLTASPLSNSRFGTSLPLHVYMLNGGA